MTFLNSVRWLKRIGGNECEMVILWNVSSMKPSVELRNENVRN